MGKQIQLFMTNNDLNALRDFLNTKYNCRYFQMHSKKKENSEIYDLAQLDRPHNQIYIWNTDYPWIPEIKQTKNADPYFYVSNYSNGPVIEIDKSDNEKGKHGRIYWAKNFTSNNLQYEVESFEKFYKSVIKWIKDYCPGKKDLGNRFMIYYMKEAWELLGKAKT